VKIQNARFKIVEADYCINFENHVEIEAVEDTGSIARQTYSFVAIDALEGKANNTIVDVIGAVV
jgi:hypothetical protein